MPCKRTKLESAFFYHSWHLSQMPYDNMGVKSFGPLPYNSSGSYIVNIFILIIWILSKVSFQLFFVFCMCSGVGVKICINLVYLSTISYWSDENNPVWKIFIIQSQIFLVRPKAILKMKINFYLYYLNIKNHVYIISIIKFIVILFNYSNS